MFGEFSTVWFSLNGTGFEWDFSLMASVKQQTEGEWIRRERIGTRHGDGGTRSRSDKRTDVMLKPSRNTEGVQRSTTGANEREGVCATRRKRSDV